MNLEEMIIEEEFEGERIDKFLAEEYEDLSRSYIQKLITSENILVNDKIVKANYRLLKGDVLKINIPESEEAKIIPEKMDLDIKYEDQDIIIVNKDKGIVVHPAPGNYSGTLVNGLMEHCNDLSGINGILRPGIVHRIDKDTSGLIVACKNDNSHRFLAEQFKDHTVERAYYALVHGIVNEPMEELRRQLGEVIKTGKKWQLHLKTQRKQLQIIKFLKDFPRVHFN
jgi:23S rRNA pseudouridine1911/1915/1917 synthase